MKRMELVKGRSYWGHGVKAVKGKPFSVADEKATELVATGCFKVVEGGEDTNSDIGAVPQNVSESEGDSDEEESGAEESKEEKSLGKMSKDELIAYAESLDIDVSECKNNGERAALIKEVLEKEETTDEGDSDEEEGAVPTFGQEE